MFINFQPLQQVFVNKPVNDPLELKPPQIPAKM